MKVLLIAPLLMLGLAVPAQAEEDPNTKILKDAIVGAVTGAVAVEATKDEPSTAVVSDKVSEKPEKMKKNFGKKSRHDKHPKKDKKRPHGWDMGKKTGWGDGDAPPGLRDK